MDHKVKAQEVRAGKKRVCGDPKEESDKQRLEFRGLHEAMKCGVAIVVRKIC
jgi:hypothetical protein